MSRLSNYKTKDVYSMSSVEFEDFEIEDRCYLISKG